MRLGWDHPRVDGPSASQTRTTAQVAGDSAEALVGARLTQSGWTVLARNVHVGRHELDLVAVDPGPPPMLVVVEVRWRRRRDFGLPEETFDHRKRGHLRAALGRLLEDGLPGGMPVPRLPVRVDLVVVEPGTTPGSRPRIRHHRDALAG
jgi:Holliday junction resolvase-like predicted endonuclease